MYFLKHKALTGTIENNSKPNNNSDIFYRCDVLDEAGRVNGHFTLGVKGSRAYLLRLKLEHYTDFDLDKILQELNMKIDAVIRPEDVEVVDVKDGQLKGEVTSADF